MKLLLKIVLYFFLGLVVLFGLGLVILSTYGGNAPEWKKQVEQMASSMTGKQVAIGDLTNARLFPNILFDGKNILAMGGIGEGRALPGQNVMVGTLQVSIPFWSVFVGSPAVQHLLIENVVISGVDDFLIDFARIETPENQPPRLRIEGEFKSEAFYIQMNLERKSGGYGAGPDTYLEASMDGSVIEGRARLSGQDVIVEPLQYIINDTSFNGAMTIAGEDGYQLTLKRQDTQFLDVKTIASSDLVISGIKGVSDPMAQVILTNLCLVSHTNNLSVSLYSAEPEIISCVEEEPASGLAIEETENTDTFVEDDVVE